MRLSKESLSKMSLQQLEGKLSEVKSQFAEASTRLSAARQNQILKMRAVKGKAAQRKKELISQILSIQKQTQKVEAQTAQIEVGIRFKFDALKSAAAAKVSARRGELKTQGRYITSLSNYEKVLAWCSDMGVEKEELDLLLEIYTMDQLADMSGDDFYDEVRSAVHANAQFDDSDEEEFTFASVFI